MHPPYSPDHALSDYHSFRSQQNSLNRKNFYMWLNKSLWKYLNIVPDIHLKNDTNLSSAPVLKLKMWKRCIMIYGLLIKSHYKLQRSGKMEALLNSLRTTMLKKVLFLNLLAFWKESSRNGCPIIWSNAALATYWLLLMTNWLPKTSGCGGSRTVTAQSYHIITLKSLFQYQIIRKYNWKLISCI